MFRSNTQDVMMKASRLGKFLAVTVLSAASIPAIAGIIYATGIGQGATLAQAQVYAEAAAYNDCYSQFGSPAGPTSYYSPQFDGQVWRVMAVVPCAV